MGPFKKKELIGLDIGTSSLKLVQLKKSAKGYELVKAGLKTLTPGAISEDEISDKQTVIESIKQLMREQKVSTKNVATSVSGRSVIVKRIKLPLMSEQELMESIFFEAEQYIPFDINDVNLDFQILPNARPKTEGEAGDPQAMDVLLIAVKKERIQDIVSIITRAGLNPSVIDIDVFALENQYEINNTRETDSYVLLLDIGADTMNMNILWEGGTVFTRDASLGGYNYLKILQDSLCLDFAQAEKLMRGEGVEAQDPLATGSPLAGVSMDQVLSLRESFYEEIFSEIQMSFDYFHATADNAQKNEIAPQITKILLSGGTSKSEGIDRALAQRFELEVERANPFQKIQINPNQFDTDWLTCVAPMMAVAVGLALRGADDR
jgi:type IV pilus assembly protein PilM